MLVAAPRPAHFNESASTVTHVDAPGRGLRAALLQKQVNGEGLVVSCANGKLTDVESHYHSSELIVPHFGVGHEQISPLPVQSMLCGGD